MSNIIALYCHVYGDSPNSAFYVRVDKSQYISDLRKAIKVENGVAFKDIDANTLTLWKVSIPSNDETKLKDLKLEDNEEKGVKKLSSEKKLGNVFPDNLAEEHIHIIVEPPGMSSTCIAQNFIYLTSIYLFIRPFRSSVRSHLSPIRSSGQSHPSIHCIHPLAHSSPILPHPSFFIHFIPSIL